MDIGQPVRELEVEEPSVIPEEFEVEETEPEHEVEPERELEEVEV